MENIYKLNGRAAELNAQYMEVFERFELLMEENGGELNEESQEYIDIMNELDSLQAQIKEDILNLPDEYAAWYKNVEAEKRVKEAELKAFKEEQKKALAKYEAKVKACDSKMEWIKQNIVAALETAEILRLDKKGRPDARFSIYFQDTVSVDVDETAAAKGYEEIISTANSVMPEGYTLVLKADKTVLKKAESLPIGAERIVRKSLQIR